MSEDEFAVVSKDPETGDVSLETYQDKEKARRMAETFSNDMPKRSFYLGTRLEALQEDE